MTPKVGLVSLGCAKATYDSERLANLLRAANYEFARNHQDADLIIINTCGFINEAIAESIEAIKYAQDNCEKLIVTGCLGARADYLRSKFPDLLQVTGPDSAQEVLSCVQQHLPVSNHEHVNLIPEPRLRLTPKHYAWLKISEGCNQNCSFCIIPDLRGKLKSRNMSAILYEAEQLVSSGVKELLIVSQDTAVYGLDIKYRKELIANKMQDSKINILARELAELGVWVRLHYLYPYPVIDRLVELMADGLILPYLDVPLQHASPKILQAMRRPANMENMHKRIENWRKICPDVVIRTTFITGFPGETEADFDLLHDFIKEVEFERMGIFTYSEVAGAAANKLSGKVDEDIKQLRKDMLLSTQEVISGDKLKTRIGNIETVLIDEVSDGEIVGRSKYDAPEVDGIVRIISNKNLKSGDLLKVKIIGSDTHDLEASTIIQ